MYRWQPAAIGSRAAALSSTLTAVISGRCDLDIDGRIGADVKLGHGVTLVRKHTVATGCAGRGLARGLPIWTEASVRTDLGLASAHVGVVARRRHCACATGGCRLCLWAHAYTQHHAERKTGQKQHNPGGKGLSGLADGVRVVYA